MKLAYEYTPTTNQEILKIDQLITQLEFEVVPVPVLD